VDNYAVGARLTRPTTFTNRRPICGSCSHQATSRRHQGPPRRDQRRSAHGDPGSSTRF